MTGREEIGERFGRNLADARKWAGLTQQQLAERVSMTQMDVSRIERGLHCPRLDTVARFAEALDVLIADLLFGVE